MAPAQTALERRVEQIADSLEGDDGLRVRLALVERGLAEHRAQSALQHQQEMAAIEGLRADLSDQGRTPPPAPPRRWTFDLAPRSGREIGLMILTILGGIGVVGGPIVGILLQEEPAAEVVSVPRVVPMPVPVAVPATAPPLPGPDPVVRP
jgi:hypothetical protein